MNEKHLNRGAFLILRNITHQIAILMGFRGCIWIFLQNRICHGLCGRKIRVAKHLNRD